MGEDYFYYAVLIRKAPRPDRAGGVKKRKEHWSIGPQVGPYRAGATESISISIDIITEQSMARYRQSTTQCYGGMY